MTLALLPVDFDPFGDGEIAEVAPATAAQTEIWTASRFGDDAELAYNESITLSLRGPLDEGAFARALQALVRRHDALRSTFSRDGQHLCVHATREVPVRWIDLRALAPEAREQALSEQIRLEATTPLDLEHGPVFRVTVCRLADDDHRVILGSHHIVCDGWSFAAVLKDLAALYSASVGAPSHVPAESFASLGPVHSFAEYAREEATRDAAAEARFWRSAFDPLPEPLDLPTDKPRPQLRSFSSDRVDLALSAELTDALKKAGAKNGASLFVTLFATFGLWLGRLTGQRDITIGVPASAQSALGRELLVGHCANLLPIRADYDPQAPVTEVLAAVRKRVLDAYDHQLFTLGAILPSLALPRDPGRLPLVNVLFNLDTGMEGKTGLAFDGLAARFRGNPRVAEAFELFLNVFESHGTLMFECQYATALWHRETVMGWLGAYVEMLRTIAADPKTIASQLPVLSSEDQRRMEAWNATRAPLPQGATVLDLVAARVRMHPERKALSDERGDLSYGQMADAVRRISSALARRGIGRGSVVGLSVPRSARMVLALLGVLDSGAAYVPVDARHPAPRIAPMLAPAAIAIVEPETEPALRAVGARTVLLHELLAEGEIPADPWTPTARPEDRAYVIFTSGSTGIPNGVEIAHENLTNFVTTMMRDPGMREDDVLLAVVTLSFDIAGYEIFVPLSSGARVVVASSAAIEDGRQLAALARSSGATVLQAPPSMYRLLRAAGFSPRGLRALVGGEMFPADLAAWLLSEGAKVVNCYGPTETTIWSTIHHVEEVKGNIPVGRPIANTEVLVLDAARAPKPIGAWGDVYIGGLGVSRGYLGRPGLTAERFVEIPGVSGRFHRTGDVGRWRQDGVLELLGRTDDQVKIRGHRIELGEVEAAISSHPSVGASAAAVSRDGAEPRIVAFVVPKPEAALTSTEVRRHLKKHLPEAWVPQMVFELTDLPRTPNGKIDRRALARQAEGARVREAAHVPPRTPAERIVAEACARAIGRDVSLGMTDHFFESGGDSLSCMGAVMEIERRTGARIAPRTLILSTLGDVAKLVEAHTSSVARSLVEAGFAAEEPG